MTGTLEHIRPSRNARLCWGAAVALAVFVAVAGCSPRTESPQTLPKMSITVGGRALAVEVAMRPAERATGMMFRKKIGPDEGMLFVFPYDARTPFYMRNTYVPLSIAFITSGGVIMNIEEMQPLKEDLHYPVVECRYALEMPAGWFERNKVKVGDRVALPLEAVATE